MPEDKENFDQENEAVISDFKRKLARAGDQGEHAERSLKKYLKQTLGPMGSEQRKSVAKDILAVTKETPSKFRGGESGGRLIDEPDPTGFEEKPWEREDE